MNYSFRKTLMKQQGFTLPEVMIGAALLAAVGLGAMYISGNFSSASKGLRNANELNRTMLKARSLLTNPEMCWINFANKGEGATLSQLSGPEGQPMMVTESNPDGGSYRLKEIKLERLDPVSNRAHAALDFEHTSKAQRVKRFKKFVGLFVKIENNVIVECLEPVKLSFEAILRKLCWDADPWNFAPSDVPPGLDSDPANNNVLCEDNVLNLVNEVRRRYCEANPLHIYQNDRCVPIDAGMDCGGGYVQGYTGGRSPGGGQKICYTPVDEPNPPEPVPVNVPPPGYRR